MPAKKMTAHTRVAIVPKTAKLIGTIAFEMAEVPGKGIQTDRDASGYFVDTAISRGLPYVAKIIGVHPLTKNFKVRLTVAGISKTQYFSRDELTPFKNPTP